MYCQVCQDARFLEWLVLIDVKNIFPIEGPVFSFFLNPGFVNNIVIAEITLLKQALQVILVFFVFCKWLLEVSFIGSYWQGLRTFTYYCCFLFIWGSVVCYWSWIRDSWFSIFIVLGLYVILTETCEELCISYLLRCKKLHGPG